MKKSTRKTINSLRKYIGHVIIRTHPVAGDWEFTDEPILLTGFTSNGRIKYISEGIFKSEECILPICFTDRHWITFKKALRPKNNPLNQWIGKEIIMTHPEPLTGDRSFTREKCPVPVTLISASRYHITVMFNDYFVNGEGLKTTFDSRFNNPDDWELA